MTSTIPAFPSIVHYIHRHISRIPQHVRETFLGTKSSLKHPHVMIMSTKDDGLVKKIVRNRLTQESYLQPYQHDSVLPLYNIRDNLITKAYFDIDFDPYVRSPKGVFMGIQTRTYEFMTNAEQTQAIIYCLDVARELDSINRPLPITATNTAIDDDDDVAIANHDSIFLDTSQGWHGSDVGIELWKKNKELQARITTTAKHELHYQLACITANGQETKIHPLESKLHHLPDIPLLIYAFTNETIIKEYHNNHGELIKKLEKQLELSKLPNKHIKIQLVTNYSYDPAKLENKIKWISALDWNKIPEIIEGVQWLKQLKVGKNYDKQDPNHNFNINYSNNQKHEYNSQDTNTTVDQSFATRTNVLLTNLFKSIF